MNALAVVCHDQWRNALAVAVEILAGFVGLALLLLAFGWAAKRKDWGI